MFHQRNVRVSPHVHEWVVFSQVEKTILIGKERCATQKLISWRVDRILECLEDRRRQRLTTQDPKLRITQHSHILRNASDVVNHGRAIRNKNDRVVSIVKSLLNGFSNVVVVALRKSFGDGYVIVVFRFF